MSPQPCSVGTVSDHSPVQVDQASADSLVWETRLALVPKLTASGDRNLLLRGYGVLLFLLPVFNYFKCSLDF